MGTHEHAWVKAWGKDIYVCTYFDGLCQCREIGYGVPEEYKWDTKKF